MPGRLAACRGEVGSGGRPVACLRVRVRVREAKREGKRERRGCETR